MGLGGHLRWRLIRLWVEPGRWKLAFEFGVFFRRQVKGEIIRAHEIAAGFLAARRWWALEEPLLGGDERGGHAWEVDYIGYYTF